MLLYRIISIQLIFGANAFIQLEAFFKISTEWFLDNSAKVTSTQTLSFVLTTVSLGFPESRYTFKIVPAKRRNCADATVLRVTGVHVAFEWLLRLRRWDELFKFEVTNLLGSRPTRYAAIILAA